MKCPRCDNSDDKFFYITKGRAYCRKCVSFRRVFLDEGFRTDNRGVDIVDSSYLLSFRLTKFQQAISDSLLSNLKCGNNVLVRAVCGAGKTELVYKSIDYYLSIGKKVCFSIPRKQVVLELKQRLQKVFINLNVVAVCEGNTKITEGDLIICTTHQLYRYHKKFHLLILDEPDAFPFKGNEVLQHIAYNSCVGEIVYLSATPDKHLLEMVNEKELIKLDLPIRPSNIPIPLPSVLYMPVMFMLVYLIVWMNKRAADKIQALIFVPTIRLSKQLHLILRNFYAIDVINSKTVDKERIIDEFRNNKLQFLLCTTILERGVTFEGIDVLIYMGAHLVYTTSSLIQIVGRIGRGVQNTKGEVCLLTNSKTIEIEKCIESIRLDNQTAYGVIGT